MATAPQDIRRRDHIAESLLFDQPSNRQDHRRPRVWWSGGVERELAQIKPVGNTAHLSDRHGAHQLARQIAPIVFAHRHYRFGTLHLGTQKLRLRIHVNVPGVRGEGIGNAAELVGEHGDQGRRRGEVRVEVIHRLPAQPVRQMLLDVGPGDTGFIPFAGVAQHNFRCAFTILVACVRLALNREDRNRHVAVRDLPPGPQNGFNDPVRRQSRDFNISQTGRQILIDQSIN